MVEDGDLEGAQLRSGFDAELLTEICPGLLVGLQRVRLTAAPVQGGDQLCPEVLVVRVGLDERGELGYHAGMVSGGQPSVHHALAGGRDELAEAHCGLSCEAELADVAERRTAYEVERLRVAAGSSVWIAAVARLATGSHEPLKPDGVHIVRPDGQEVAMASAFDGVAAEQPAQDGELCVQGVRRVAWQVLFPHLVDQPLRGDRLR